MVADQNNQTNDQPTEDGLSALKKLAALGQTTSGAAAGGEVAETIPDWLELLLAKYGERASALVGLQPQPVEPEFDSFGMPQPVEGEEPSKMASLLDQMATEPQTSPTRDSLATSVDWGQSAIEEEAEEEPDDWLSRISETPAQPAAPVEEEGLDWLAEIDQMEAEAGASAEPPQQPGPTERVEGVPDWLQELAPSPEPSPQAQAPPPKPAEPSPPSTAKDDIPDWLSDLDAAAPGAEPPSTPIEIEAAGDHVPDWLEQLAGAPTTEETARGTPAPQAESFRDREAPDWLQEMDVEADVSTEAVSHIPDWLREPETAEEPSPPQPTAGPPVIEPVAESPAEPAEVPDWLRDLEPPAVETPPALTPSELPSEMLPVEPEAEVPGEPEAEVPDWMVGLRSEEERPRAEEVESPAEAGAEMPDWLAALKPPGETDVPEVSSPQPEDIIEPEEGELPEWLRELQATREAPSPLPTEEEVGEVAEIQAVEPMAEVSDWLAELPAEETPPIEGVEVPSVEPVLSESVEPDEAGALDWLAEIEALEEEAITPAPETEVVPPPMGETVPEQPPEVEAVSPAAELPDWLQEAQLEEYEEVEPGEQLPTELPPPEEVVEAEGVLAGLPGLLPETEEEPEEEEIPIRALRSRSAVPEVPDVEGARLFGKIVSEEGEVVAEPEPEPRRSRILGMLIWALVFIVLIALIAVVLVAVINQAQEALGGSDFVQFFGSTAMIDRQPVDTFRTQIMGLPPDAVVVVSFDYGPATEAEMGPLAELIVRDLLNRQARVVAVSLRPEGAGMAQLMLERLHEDYPQGDRTLNAGYLPGQTAGVRSLAFLSETPLFRGDGRTMRDLPSWQDVDGLGDVALIVDIADNPFSVRWWVEQVGPGTQAGRPMVAAVSAAADPTVRPYYDHYNPQAGQLLGLVSGVTGTAAYEARLGKPGRATQSLAAQSVVHLGLMAVSIGGTFVGFQSRSKE